MWFWGFLPDGGTPWGGDDAATPGSSDGSASPSGAQGGGPWGGDDSSVGHGDHHGEEESEDLRTVRRWYEDILLVKVLTIVFILK